MTANFEQLSAGVTVTDGAWGTQLHQLGLDPGATPDLWNLDNPAAVESVARSYVDAGSQVILTNTFSSSPLAVGETPDDRLAAIVETGAAISRRVAGESAAVFGSIGPTGKIIMMGEVPADRLSELFAVQADALARGGVDAIVCETFPELDEIVPAIRAAVATGLPVVASMTFDSGPDKTNTMMGVTPAAFAAAAAEAGASAVGANCGAGPEHFVTLTGLLREATDLPIWIKPNAGLPFVEDGRTVFPLGPDEFAAKVRAIIDAGCWLCPRRPGSPGCCRPASMARPKRTGRRLKRNSTRPWSWRRPQVIGGSCWTF